MDPQLVDEHWQVGVELVVADPCGKHDQGAWVVDRYPWCLAHDLVVDARPQCPGRAGVVGLECEGLGDLGVDPVVLLLPGLPGRKDRQVSSVRMKSDGAG